MRVSDGAPRASRNLGWLVAAVWLVSYLVARGALDKELHLGPPGLRIAAALLPVVPTIVLLWFIVKGIRGLDELHRRVHLEALAVAYPLAVVLLMTLGLLQLAIDLPIEDWSYRHVWVYLPLFYFAGLTLAWRRYR